MVKIHDIKPIVTIPDYTIYLFYGGIFIVCVVVCFLLFVLYKYLKNKNKKSKEYYYLQQLKNIDFELQKKSAYTITKYGRLLAKDDRQKRLIEELIEDLEPYKYKKDINDKITKNIKTKFETFLDSIDV